MISKGTRKKTLY